MKPKHLKFNETQRSVCGACESPFIIKMHEGIGIYRCMDCHVNLTSAMPNRRKKIADYDVSDENREVIKKRNGDSFVATLKDDNDVAFLFRLETDDEMRERCEQNRQDIQSLPNVGGQITLKTFNQEEIDNQINIGTDEMQQARVLARALSEMGCDSLSDLTRELNQLRLLKDALNLHAPSVVNSDDVNEYISALDIYNPAQYALEAGGTLFPPMG